MNLNVSRKIILFTSALALLASLTSGVPVLAGDFPCTGSLGSIVVDSMRVPQNATCTLNGTTVKGNITIEANATLNAYDVKVDSNIQADNAANVNVYSGSYVGGNIQVKNSGAANIQSVDINSNLYFDGNNHFLNAANTTIGGNLQAFDNTGGVSITGNTVDGNLQCKDNNPPPTGSGNIVSGNIEDQCTGFADDPFAALVAKSDQYTLTRNQIRVSAPGILENDVISSLDPPVVELTRQPQHGAVTLGQEGDFVYQMQSGYYGPDSFEYKLISNGNESKLATVQLSVNDQEAPSLIWTAPVSAQGHYDVGEGEQVVLEVGVSDNFSIGQVKFLRWDAVNEQYITLNSLTQAPYRLQISASDLNPGWNQIFVAAWDLAGNSSGYSYIWLVMPLQGQTGFQIYLPSTTK